MNLAADPRVVGIGECGLDFHYDLSPRDIQAKVFRQHVHAARETGLPLVVHTREADDVMGAILEEEYAQGPFRLLMHCYTSGADLARRAAALGAWFSVSGIATFKAAEDVREKMSILRPTLRDEVKEPRVLRFDPAGRPIYTLALTSPDGSRTPLELTTYADQIVKKRLENVRGVGSVTLVGGIKREVISRCYNLLIKAIFRNKFSDAQCGFKAVKRSVAQQLIPEIENNEWFFDTELLLLAEERGMRIYEVPVDWIEDLDSRVRIVSTATEDIKGLLRVRARRLRQRRRALAISGD